MDEQINPNLTATGSFAAIAGSEAATVSVAPSGIKPPEMSAAAAANSAVKLPEGLIGGAAT